MDLILRNARLAEGGGIADIGIAGGRIVAIGPALAATGEEIDIAARLVSPGFVETHIHLDKTCILDRCRAEEGTLEEAVREVGETMYRIWRLYMSACALEFENGGTGIYQILASRRGAPFSPDPVPLTRDDIYAPRA